LTQKEKSLYLLLNVDCFIFYLLPMPDNTAKLLAFPSDDELYALFLAAAQEGAHDNIRGIVKQIGGFLGKAQGEVKKILTFDSTL
jgi:hypothetical protein